MTDYMVRLLDTLRYELHMMCQILRIEGVAWSAQRIPTDVNLDFLDLELLLFHSSSSSVTLTRLSGPPSRPTTSQKIW
jgi:hypothetical protein